MIVRVRVQRRLAADDILRVFFRRFQQVVVHPNIRRSSAAEHAELGRNHESSGNHYENRENKSRKNFFQWGPVRFGQTRRLTGLREDATTA